jgi:hypothetical protein
VTQESTVSGTTVSFDDLVTAATVGVARKPLPLPGDPAGALLDAAARETVARRAGYQPLRGVAAAAAPAETAPALSARAARALREACGWKPDRGFPADSALLPDLLTAAAGAGYVAPALLLPDLLDAAVRRGTGPRATGHRGTLRPAVVSVLGARGRWLARQRPDWAQVGEEPPAAGAAGPEDDGRHRPPSAWPPDQDLAATLPPEERAGRAADLLANLRLTTANPPGWGEPASPPLAEIAEIAGLPVPWPQVLADAVIDVVDRAVTMPTMPGVVRNLLPAAARGLPATGPRDYGAVLARFADAYPRTWPATLRATAYAIACRRVFLQEIGLG